MLKKAIHSMKMDPILLCGNVSLIKSQHFFRFNDQDVEIISRASVSEALAFVKQERCSAILFCTEGLLESELAILNQIRFLQSQTPIILAASKITEDLILNGINQVNIFRFIHLPITLTDLEIILNSAMERNYLYQNRSSLLKESSLHNRELEALTTSLEEIVEERTRFVEESNNEQSDKLARERQLIRFITDLSAQNGFEDILHTLRRDMKRFHHLADPILIYRYGAGKVRYWNFQSTDLRITESLDTFEFPQAIAVQDPIVSQALANHYGRPFTRAVLLPLELKITSLSWRGAEAFLCFENSLNEKDLPIFLDFISERAEALGIVLDRVLLEEHLETFSWRWEKTFDGMRDPIAIIDMDYNVVRSNNKFGERFSNKKCYELFAARNSACENCPSLSALKLGVAQVQTINNQGRIYQVHSYPVRGGEGKASAVMHQYVDVTQSRELYLRMLQSEKMGAIGLLAGNIAHELNNPLTGLRSLSQIMISETMGDENSQLHGDLVEIEKAAARSQGIIKNLLDFSRGDLGVLEITEVDELIQKTMPMLKTALRMHRLHLHLNGSGFSIKVEPHLVQQVVFNLVNNACQAMKDIGDLTVRTGSANGRVFIEVEDNGPGISDEIQSKIFEPFFTTKQEGHGTGLGLSLAKSVIEKFSGELSLHAVKPHGVCFRIELPEVTKGEL